MKRFWLGLLMAGFAASAGVATALPPGSMAPEFKGIDSNGALAAWLPVTPHFVGWRIFTVERWSCEVMGQPAYRHAG